MLPAKVKGHLKRLTDLNALWTRFSRSRTKHLLIANFIATVLGVSVSYAYGHWIPAITYGAITLIFRYLENVPLVALGGSSELASRLSVKNRKDEFSGLILLRFIIAAPVVAAVWWYLSSKISPELQGHINLTQVGLITAAAILSAQTTQWLLGQKDLQKLAAQRVTSKIVAASSLWGLYFMREDLGFAGTYFTTQSILLILLALWYLRPSLPKFPPFNEIKKAAKITLTRVPDILASLEVVIVSNLVPTEELYRVYLPMVFGATISSVLEPTWTTTYKAYISNNLSRNRNVRRIKDHLFTRLRKQAWQLGIAFAFLAPVGCLLLFKREYYFLIPAALGYAISYFVAHVGIPARYALIATGNVRYQAVHSATVLAVRLLIVALAIQFLGPQYAWLSQFIAYAYSVILAEIYFKNVFVQTTRTNGSPTK